MVLGIRFVVFYCLGRLGIILVVVLRFWFILSLYYLVYLRIFVRKFFLILILILRVIGI